MNVVFISHCDFTGNSAMHIFSIANVLSRLGGDCTVCVPNDANTIQMHGLPAFTVVPYEEARANGVRFSDGRGPDLIHAWTPRELVRKLTECLVERYACHYLVHLEDNEEAIVEAELRDRTYDELSQLPAEALDRLIPEHRSHPLRYRAFLSKAAGVTTVMDRLLEFKPEGIPGLVFWPGFDEEFRDPKTPSPEFAERIRLRPGEHTLVYNGNIHDANADEVRSLFLAVQALRRKGVSIRLLKSGWTYVDDKLWIDQAIQCGAVIDLGFLPRSDVHSLLTVADVLVQPGRPDRFNEYRFPSKLPEFLVSGKPVVLPKTNLGRFVRPDVEAVLLEYGDGLEIARQIERLLDQPQLAKRIGQAGRGFALRRLVWAKNVPVIKDFYGQALRRNLIGGVRTEEDPETSIPAESSVKLIAFFLPQFHPVKENDEFWGTGFTEWTNVSRAEPNYEGHYQPQLPADLGYYDLRVPEVLEQQADLARSFGIHGFCFYYYWFNGRRVLERPLEQMLLRGKPDFPFCICWANENWTRSWDGSHNEVLIGQDYSGDACERFIRDVIPILKDSRYILVNGAPMLLVYRMNLLPDPIAVTRMWRDICFQCGIDQLHICAVQSFGIGDPQTYGCDAAVEFPPHTKRALVDPKSFPGVRSDFQGYLEDYPTIVRNQLSSSWPDYLWYRGVMPAWDNTPRRGTSAHILIKSSPELYESWLYALVKQALSKRAIQEPILFVNAWNEWAEGAYLEPDQKYGHSRLIATRRALSGAVRDHEIETSHHTCAFSSAQTNVSANGAAGAELTGLFDLYRNYPVSALSYARVEDYCDSFDHLHGLATANGDLKDCQRPWIVKALLAKVPPPARIVEIGAGEPLVADLLFRLGYEVLIVDPYDGSGNGPTQYEEFRARYPHLKFVRSTFHDCLSELAPHTVDCVYSISVLEHVTSIDMRRVFSGVKRFLKAGGKSIHAIDHVHRGNGAAEHLANLRFMVCGFGFGSTELDRLLVRMVEDTETYYLSAESHNRWRAGVPYCKFPMRVCVSIQVVADASAISLAQGGGPLVQPGESVGQPVSGLQIP